MPEMQTVRLGNMEEDSTVLFIPTCTRIERCGGCCTHSLLECQPTESETVNFQVNLKKTPQHLLTTKFVGFQNEVYRLKEASFRRKTNRPGRKAH